MEAVELVVELEVVVLVELRVLFVVRVELVRVPLAAMVVLVRVLFDESVLAGSMRMMYVLDDWSFWSGA
jgi:hypothetical protein